jgi:endoglucanase
LLREQAGSSNGGRFGAITILATFLLASANLIVPSALPVALRADTVINAAIPHVMSAFTEFMSMYEASSASGTGTQSTQSGAANTTAATAPSQSRSPVAAAAATPSPKTTPRSATPVPATVNPAAGSTARPSQSTSPTPTTQGTSVPVHAPSTPAPLATQAPAAPSAVASSPTIQIRSPLTEKAYSGTISVDAFATNVTSVSYRVDESGDIAMSYEQSLKIWRAPLNTTTVSNGIHNITVIGLGFGTSVVQDRAWRIQVSNATATSPPVVTPAPTSPPVAARQGAKVFGVNVNGAEFGDQNLPGTANTDYVYPTEGGRQSYLASKSLSLVRLPFRWERVQRSAMAPLHADDIAGLRSVLEAARVAGEKVILDLHNYGRYYGAPLTKADAARFADVWGKIAAEFRGHPALFGYELMNEPHDLPEGSDSWAFLSQAATDAIRRADTTSWILIPGYGWQTARYWPENNASLNINDPSGKLLYAAHQYFDADYTGSYSRTYDADKTYPTIGVDRVRPFLDWLAARNVRGILTEYGVPDNDPRWLDVLEGFLSALDADARVLGGTYWACGPWWGTYPLSVEPRNGIDRPQMSVLARHGTRN